MAGKHVVLKYTFVDPNGDRTAVERALRQMILEKLSPDRPRKGAARH